MSRLLLLFVCFAVISESLFAQVSKDYAKEIKLHRKTYRDHFIEEKGSPLDKKQVKGLNFYEADEKYRVKATFVRADNNDPFLMPVYAGTASEYIRYGVFNFMIDSVAYQLHVYQSTRLMNMGGYRDYLFLPFKDLTNGTETYGGGRYIDFRLSDIINNKAVIDFNKAYNPYCAYTTGYSCPVPPKENHLPLSIPAGEKLYQPVSKQKSTPSNH